MNTFSKRMTQAKLIAQSKEHLSTFIKQYKIYQLTIWTVYNNLLNRERYRCRAAGQSCLIRCCFRSHIRFDERPLYRLADSAACNSDAESGSRICAFLFLFRSISRALHQRLLNPFRSNNNKSIRRWLSSLIDLYPHQQHFGKVKVK